MRTAESPEFRPMNARAFAGLVGLLLAGAVFLVVSLLSLVNSRPPAPPGEGLERWAATAGLGVGVMLLSAVMAALLVQVAHLSRTVARLLEQPDAAPDRDEAPVVAGSCSSGSHREFGLNILEQKSRTAHFTSDVQDGIRVVTARDGLFDALPETDESAAALAAEVVEAFRAEIAGASAVVVDLRLAGEIHTRTPDLVFQLVHELTYRGIQGALCASAGFRHIWDLCQGGSFCPCYPTAAQARAAVTRV